MSTGNELVDKWLIRREALEAMIRPAALRHGIMYHEIPAVMGKVLPVFVAQFLKDFEARELATAEKEAALTEQRTLSSAPE